MDAVDAIRTIQAAGGIPVLAHPGQFDNFESIEEWVRYGLRGIEVYHPLHDERLEEKAKECAERYQLIMTGGSDFHGGYGPSETFPLGSKTAWHEVLAALNQKLSINVE